MERRLAQHEVDRALTTFGAVEEGSNVAGFSVLATLLQTVKES
jgi:hypothetical protein